jgi:hypothetical protein
VMAAAGAAPTPAMGFAGSTPATPAPVVPVLVTPDRAPLPQDPPYIH